MITPRGYQTKAVESLFHYFTQNDGNPLLVLPTASGKSVIQAMFIKQAQEQYAGTRFMLVTHVKELLEQNAERLKAIWPEADVGLYSAGLKRRDTDNAIVVAGIQSVFRRAREFGRVHLVMIDEAHLVPKEGEGMYISFLDELRKLNPGVKVIGMSATPYRMGSGMLHRGEKRIFTDIAFDADIGDLVRNGYLCPLTSKLGKTRADLSRVQTRGGEFVVGSLERTMDTDTLVKNAVKEIVKLCADRSKWLIFCCGVEHAQHVRDELGLRGVAAACVTGKTPAAERAQILADFKGGKLRAVTNMNVLTTGFDAPDIDAIVMLRPTMSTGLYVQMVGRGMRLHETKTDTLVLDFAENVLRHGPVDRIKIKDGTEQGVGVAPMKECPSCNAPVLISLRECPGCGHEFPFDDAPKHSDQVTGGNIMASTVPIEELEVDGVEYNQHRKTGKPPSLRVDYRCGLMKYREWICFEHQGFARRKAVEWWLRRTADIPELIRPAVPTTINEAMDHVRKLPTPTKITVSLTEKYPRIVGCSGLGFHEPPAFEARLPDPGRGRDYAPAIADDDVPF